jgi:hypothetical protein
VGDQPVTQLNRIAERFHCQRPLRHARQIEKIRHGSKRENKVIVFERVRMPIETV